MKRTTTYSGKINDFFAKLETDEVLKKTKKDQYAFEKIKSHAIKSSIK